MTPTLRPFRRRATGFTLLEVLLAISITAVVALVAFTALATAFDTREQAERVLDRRAAGRIALDLLVRDLVATVPPTGTLAGPFLGEDATDRLGDDDTLTFITASDATPGDGAGDLRKITWSLANAPSDPEQRILGRGVVTNLLATVTRDPVVEPVAIRVLGLNFRYHDGTTWQDAWDSEQQQNALPAAVEVTLTFALQQDPDDDRDWERPTLRLTRVVALPASTITTTTTTGSTFQLR